MSFQTTDADVAEAITRQFIDENPLEVTLVRSQKTQTSAGGWVLQNPTNLLPQTVRLVPGQMYADTVRTTSDGREVNPTFTIVAPMDADMERFDTFSIDDFDYEIVWFYRKPLFQRSVGEVWRYGE